MEDLIRKYFDGELNEQEAREFMEALAESPELTAEVEITEKSLDLARTLPRPLLSPGFTEQVMNRVLESDGAGHSIAPLSNLWKAWSRPLPLAASWILALGLGVFLARGLPVESRMALPLAQNSTQAVTAQQAARPVGDSRSALKMVRLVYFPQQDDIREVGVAGTFNNWDAKRSPLHLENGYWVTNLLLPAGDYDYMFVLNHKNWVTDPFAPTTRDDGFGRRNAVLELEI